VASPTELLPGAPNAVLRETFGHQAFRRGQDDAVRAVLRGQDAMVLLPTGGGKSLCYQVPGLIKRRSGGGTTLVISPLIALMQDQVAALVGRGIRAAALHSQQDEDERRRVASAFLDGLLDFLYVSPERAVLSGFRSWLERVPIGLIAIDEAHCVSQWGHDFRPEYMRLHELRQEVSAPLVALTATATPRVLEEVVRRLEMKNPVMVQGDFRRPNLSFAVRHVSRDATRLALLIEELDRIGLRDKASGPGRAIVYCSTRKKTEWVATELRSRGFPCAYYHAGRTTLQRDRVQQGFERSKVRVLVGTNAFGMGIDLPDVRLVVHFQTPGSLEAYYQEAGRAGRDGEAARCLLYFGAGDLVTQRRLQGDAKSPQVARHQEDALRAVERYTVSTECRQAVLCQHFGEPEDSHVCERCDVCRGEVVDSESETTEARAPREALSEPARALIVEAVSHLECPVGKTALARSLRGSRAKALERGGLLRIPQHGQLKRYDEASLVAGIDVLVEEGRLERRGQKFPTIWLPGKRVPSVGGKQSERGDAGSTRETRPKLRKGGNLARLLDNYRKKMARALKWKPYMVFQRRSILAIEANEPSTLSDLARIPGLGETKVERFGEDILAIVRRHTG
jgi:ATP-dependent DNA helicase RecQ